MNRTDCGKISWAAARLYFALSTASPTETYAQVVARARIHNYQTVAKASAQLAELDLLRVGPDGRTYLAPLQGGEKS